MHVAHFKTRALGCKTTAAEGRKCAEVFDLVEGVVLLHELGKLVGREEFTDRRLERARIDERHRSRCLGINHGHAVLDVALHAGKAHAHALFEELAGETDAAEAQVVDVVCLCLGIHIRFCDVCDDADDILERECDIGEIGFLGRKAETAVEMEAADT